MYQKGDVIDHLTVVDYNLDTGRYKCVCACGNTTEAGATALANGKHKSCGCPNFRSRPHLRTITIGDVFGHLTVTGYQAGKWLCSCVCGGTTIVEATRLKTGARIGCGCRVSTAQRPEQWLPDNLSFKRKLYGTYLRQAAKRGLNFSLTHTDFYSYLSLACHYCGCSPANTIVAKSRTGRSVRTFEYNGLDRINSSEGYSLSNVVPCCGVCNLAKSNLTLDQWEAWVRRVYTHMIVNKEAKGKR